MDSRDFGKKKVSRYFPEHGAIFMSNKSTLRECFDKRLFGLPDAQSGFVKKVKAGMILFRFEFEERKLYGVFEAISDGGMNIVPHAYVSSGKKFPAQVKFATILHCDPLYENEFHDAIQDNYFSTYKFNFGLSKDQIERLMWLFESKKHQVPRSLNQNKRKKRKWVFQIIEDVLMKGRSTNIQYSKRKVNTNHGTSVTEDQEVEKLSSSPDSCRKYENIHYDYDDAYDPENPGFNHPVGSGAHSAASDELHELPALQKKEVNFHIFEEDTEDFIPLCSTDNSDLEDGELDDFSDCSEENQIELDMLVGNEVSSIPVPRFLLSDEESNRLADPSSAAVSDLQSKDEKDDLNSLLSKGMYSDEPKKRTSVFSRLNFTSNGIAWKNQNDASGMELVNNMSRAKHPCQYEYEYENIEKVTQQSENGAMYRRASVFLRLTGASGAFSD